MRLTPQYQGDRPLSVELDAGFRGIDQRATGEGLLMHALNMRFGPGRTGYEARTRPGCITPVELNPYFLNILGAGTFAMPGGRRVTLVAEEYQVWRLGEGYAPAWYPLAADVRIQEACTITQVYASCLICRGFGAETLVLQDGVFCRAGTVPNLTPEILAPIPNTPFAVMQGDRAWFPVDSSTIGYTDLLDYAHWDPALNRVPVNAGDSDALVAIVPWRKSVLIVFKDRSIFSITGATGDLSGLAVESIKTPGRDNTGIGCWARDSVAEVGGDLFFLALGGLYKLSEVLQDSVQLEPQPLSEPVRDYMARVNWAAARGASAVLAGSLYYLALPLDGSAVNNALLVYDSSTGYWQGMDLLGTGPLPAAPAGGGIQGAGGAGVMMTLSTMGLPVAAADCRRLLLADVHGQRVPLWVEPRRILALGLGWSDKIGDADLGIVTEGRTRGYTLGDLGLKKFRAITAAFATWACALTWRVVTDGAHSSRSLAHGFTPDRRRWRIHGKPRWNVSNAADDFQAPGREDYAWRAGDGSQPRSGLQLHQAQDWSDGFPLHGMARWVALEWRSTSGTVALKSAFADGLTDRNQLARSPS